MLAGPGSGETSFLRSTCRRAKFEKRRAGAGRTFWTNDGVAAWACHVGMPMLVQLVLLGHYSKRPGFRSRARSIQIADRQSKRPRERRCNGRVQARSVTAERKNDYACRRLATMLVQDLVRPITTRAAACRPGEVNRKARSVPRES